MTIHESVYAREFQLSSHVTHAAPRQVYIHDFFATRRFFVHVLHPCYFKPFPFLLGLRRFTEALDWRGEDGNIVVVHPRGGGEPISFEAPGAFMWHALNAHETRDEIVADFVAYDEPDHFLGKEAAFATIMQGRMGLALSPGKIRRYVLDLNARTLKEETLDAGNHEFPMIDERAAMRRQDVGYFACGGAGALNSGVKRLDYRAGAVQQYDFGPDVHVGEPVFAPRANLDEGCIITQCLDGASGTSFFAVFDAETISAGPVAKIWLEHHAPMSFHGAWLAGI
jgi:all-trans-8'-apo-beta-carotenal 15,15'-oxygenase